MIEFKNVSIGYKNTALFSVGDLQLESGKLYILIGKNGSGKSTLLKTIVGSQELLQGEITLENQSMKSISKQDLAKKVAFVQSTFPLTEYLKVNEYIALGRSPHTNAFGRLSSNDKDAVNSAIETLNISHLSEKFTSELSDGERQLVAIAKAFCQDTSVILLDEPTAFLDYTNKTLLHNTLKRIAENTNKCIVLSSHDLELSLETNSDFLAVHSTLNALERIEAPTTKEILVKIAFA